MAKLTGRFYKEYFKRPVKTNSFYETTLPDPKIGNEYMTGLPEVVYYIDKKDTLSAKETTLIW